MAFIIINNLLSYDILENVVRISELFVSNYLNRVVLRSVIFIHVKIRSFPSESPVCSYVF